MIWHNEHERPSSSTLFIAPQSQENNAGSGEKVNPPPISPEHYPVSRRIRNGLAGAALGATLALVGQEANFYAVNFVNNGQPLTELESYLRVTRDLGALWYAAWGATIGSSLPEIRREIINLTNPPASLK